MESLRHSVPHVDVAQSMNEMRARVHAFDWSATPLGSMDTWPQSLRTAVATALDCGFPMVVLWGPQLIQIYNDTYRLLMGAKHPLGLGQPMQVCWPEVWHLNEPICARVWQGETVMFEDALYPIMRGGVLEDAYFTLCYSPLRDEHGSVAGVLMTVFETTARLQAAATREGALQRALDERRVITEALQASEERARLATEAAELGIWDWDPVTDRISWLNERLYEIFGMPRTAPAVNAAQFAADFVYHEDAAAFAQAVTAMQRADASFVFEGRMWRSDGTLRWVAFHGRWQEAGPHVAAHVLGTAADITERKQFEIALRASEERYRTLFESIDAGFCIIEVIFDDADKAMDYRFVEVNPAFERQTGITHAEGRTVREIAPLHEEHWFEIYGHIARTGEPMRFEDRADEFSRFYDVFAFRIGLPAEHKVAVLFNDISARRNAELALAERERQLRILLEVSDGARDLNDEGDIARMACRIVKDEMNCLRCSYGFVYPETDRVLIVADECDANNDVPCIKGEHALSSFGPDLLDLHEHGEPVVIEDTATHVTTAAFQQTTFDAMHTRSLLSIPLIREGRFEAYFSIHNRVPRRYTDAEVRLLRDVAARVWEAIQRAHAEAAVRESTARLQVLYAQEREARAQAEEASRMRDDFLANVSHELRTPLTAIMGYAQLLQVRPRDAAYTERTAGRILKSAQAQAQLTEDLLDVSRITAGKLRLEMQSVNLAVVIQAAIDAVRPAAEAKQLQLNTDFDPTIGHVRGDPHRLQQVVWNLLSNAVKFTPFEGQITVSLRHDDMAILTVRDTGQGIDAAFLPYVFERFRQADSTSTRAHSGLGLGLALVRHLVELHGGEVEAQSNGLQQGATFIVRLPQQTLPKTAIGVHDAADARTSVAYPGELQGLRIVVVDDEPMLTELLDEMLQASGADVRVCSTARNALDMVRLWRPDVLISDIAMPSEDGYWLIRELRALPADVGGATPALALTAYVRVEDRVRVLAAGFQEYVPKPVEAAELRAAIVRLAHRDALDRVS